MRILVLAILVLSFSLFAFTFSLGVFEYQTGPRGYAEFSKEVNVGKFDFGIKHWIFFRVYDFGFYDFPKRLTPYQWESSGGWWDVYVKLNLSDNVYLKFLHRSEHNFDGGSYLKIHWYNFFGIYFEF